MKTSFRLMTLAVALVAPGPCYAIWDIAVVGKDEAKALGIEVRTTASTGTHVGVEVEFKIEGEFDVFDPKHRYLERSHVDLRLGHVDKPALTVTMREDRSKPGFVAVRFSAEQVQVENLRVWIYVPGELGGSIYDVRIRDFVEVKKDR